MDSLLVLTREGSSRACQLTAAGAPFFYFFAQVDIIIIEILRTLVE